MPKHWLKNERFPELPVICIDVPEGGELSPEYERAMWLPTDEPPEEDEPQRPAVKHARKIAKREPVPDPLDTKKE